MGVDDAAEQLKVAQEQYVALEREHASSLATIALLRLALAADNTVGYVVLEHHPVTHVTLQPGAYLFSPRDLVIAHESAEVNRELTQAMGRPETYHIARVTLLEDHA